MQVGNFRAPRRPVFLALKLRVAAKQVVVGRFEFFQFSVGDEIIDRFIIAVAHLHHEMGQGAVASAFIDVIGKITTKPFDINGMLVERFKQR